MAREYRFVHVDVFTDRVFGGNPLAVVLDARGLRDVEMQAIALEMNLSETTFVLPPTRTDCTARVRIFTPARELSFAGHPTLGTAWVLARERRGATGITDFALEEGIGPVPVTVDGAFAWMRHREATFAAGPSDRASIATALGLNERDLLHGVPIETGSTGNAFLFVPLTDQGAVDRCAVDAGALARVLPEGAIGVFVVAPDGEPHAGRVYSRMFAPHQGVPEDPATGSASGPLGAYLVRHGVVKAADDVRIVSEQGTKMGRQSFVHIRLRTRDGRAMEIAVGGGVVPVLEGTLRVP